MPSTCGYYLLFVDAFRGRMALQMMRFFVVVVVDVFRFPLDSLWVDHGLLIRSGLSLPHFVFSLTSGAGIYFFLSAFFAYYEKPGWN